MFSSLISRGALASDTLCQASKEDLVDGVEEGQPKKPFSQVRKIGIEVYVKIVIEESHHDGHDYNRLDIRLD